jgi:HD-like signal output (HDOD) protein
MMHAAMPEAMLDLDCKVNVLDITRSTAEQHLFGYSYAEVGAALAEEWRFPVKMVNAIRYQTAPFDNTLYEPIAGVIHIASWRARGQEMSLSTEGLTKSYPGAIGVVLGVDPDSVMGEVIPTTACEKEDALQG